MQAGDWQVSLVLDGSFLLDGGSMFGIVPRSLWSRLHPPDEQGRIVMALRTMLLQGQGRIILVDCGIGGRFSEKQQKIYAYQPNGGGIEQALEKLGVSPEQVTDVVASHLHFDHVAGMLKKEANGGLRPAFPRARVHVQRECWQWARNPCDWDRASFFAEDLAIWERKLDLHLLDGEEEIAPGISVLPTRGHMPGHQVVVVEGPPAVVFCADLIPTAAHLKPAYIMAYDHRPVDTLEEKKLLLARALEGNWILVFEHDPKIASCRLELQNGQAAPGQFVCLQGETF